MQSLVSLQMDQPKHATETRHKPEHHLARALPAQTILRAAQGWKPHCAGCVSAYIQSRVSLQMCQLKHAAENRHNAEQ